MKTPEILKDVYVPPFVNDGGMIYDSKGMMSLMGCDFNQKTEQLLDRICELLNDKSKPRTKQNLTFNQSEIYLNGELFLVIRGWGRLVGEGCMELSTEVAAKIQDDFAKWVIGKLSGK